MVATRLRADGLRIHTVDLQPALGPDHVQGDITESSSQVRTLLGSVEAVVLAVPESVALAAIPVLSKSMAEQALLVDTLSVKSRFAAALQSSELCNSAVGINPMFAPTLDPSGRPIAAVTYRGGRPVDWFLSRMSEGWGASVVSLDAERHDRLTAVTQALTHAGILAFGLALAELGVDGRDLTALATPPHLMSLALLARVGGGVPEVYWDIQSANPFAREARLALTSALHTLVETVDHGTEHHFGALMARACSPLGDEQAPLAALCADIFTDSLRPPSRVGTGTETRDDS